MERCSECDRLFLEEEAVYQVRLGYYSVALQEPVIKMDEAYLCSTCYDKQVQGAEFLRDLVRTIRTVVRLSVWGRPASKQAARPAFGPHSPRQTPPKG